MLEMMRLAEEARHIGGQRGEHLLAFVGAVRARHQRAILR